MTGVVDQLHWLALAMMLPRLVNGHWHRLLAVALVTGAALAISGVASSMMFAGRTSGITGNPGLLAVFLMATIPTAIVIFARQRHGWHWLALAVFATYALDLTATRAALLGLIVALSLLCVMAGRFNAPPRRIWASSGLVVVLLVVLALLPGNAGVVDRAAGNVGDHSTLLRFEFAALAIDAALVRPVLGNGPNTFARVYVEAHPEAQRVADYPHNMVAQEVYEKGVLGLFTFLALGLAAWRLWRSREPLALLMLGLLLALAAYGLFWFLSWYMALWLCLAMGYALEVERRAWKSRTF